MRRLAAALGTLVFPVLLSHRSDSAAVIGRYSVEYSFLLILFGVNVLFLWFRASRSAPRLLERLAWSSTLSLIVALFCVVFLIDLFSFSPHSVSPTPARGVILALIVAIPVQIDTLRSRSSMLPRLAVVMSMVVVSIIALECLMVFMLLQSVTPRTEREFLNLMRNPDYFGWTPWPEPITQQKPPGTYWFIGLADSFGIWGGAESNYFRVLETLLQAESPAPVQLVNLSIAGYDPNHELRILRFGMDYSPDLVVHGFFVGNDFTLSDERIDKFLGIRTYRTPDAVPYRPRDFRLRSWVDAVREMAAEKRQKERETQAGITSGTLSREAFLWMQQSWLNTWGRRGEANLRSLRLVFPLLDEIRRVAESGGARYVLVIHPDQMQIDESLRREIFTKFRLREEDFDFDLPQKVVLEYCGAWRVTCLDLLPTFRAHGHTGDLYLLRDTHYNEAGRHLVAEAIRDFLAAQAIGPPRQPEARKQVAYPKGN